MKGCSISCWGGSCVSTPGRQYNYRPNEVVKYNLAGYELKRNETTNPQIT